MKNKTIIHQQLQQILINMGIAEKAITEQASFYKDLGLDSLDFTELIIELEFTFSTEIPTLEAEKIQTIRQATDYLTSRLAKVKQAN
ncbi:MAG: acyl carrier protein [Bacteroidota bacterium]